MDPIDYALLYTLEQVYNWANANPGVYLAVFIAISMFTLWYLMDSKNAR